MASAAVRAAAAARYAPSAALSLMSLRILRQPDQWVSAPPPFGLESCATRLARPCRGRPRSRECFRALTAAAEKTRGPCFSSAPRRAAFWARFPGVLPLWATPISRPAQANRMSAAGFVEVSVHAAEVVRPGPTVYLP